jgi:hypothetical protein
VAALPVSGPLDVIGDSGVGVLDWDLRAAAMRALAIPRDMCRVYALRFSWRASIQQFLGNLVPGAHCRAVSSRSPPDNPNESSIASRGKGNRSPSTPCL